ncbi:MAG: hypothetical protein EHM65_11160, partial [Acidobacteriales bacterium]
MRSRIWPILIIGFGSMVVLIGLAGLGAARRASQIYTEMASIHESHRTTTQVLSDIRSGVNLSGIFVRDYLLDPSQLTAPLHRQRLVEIRASMATEVEDLERRLGSEQAGALAGLRREL